jgi:radical SAM protein with 4Fe4S-binding SPASM domain
LKLLITVKQKKDSSIVEGDRKEQIVGEREYRYHCLNESIIPRHKCQKCVLQNRCGGGCPAVNFSETGNFYYPDDVACKLGMVCLFIDDYFRKRHDEIFGTNWVQQVKDKEETLNLQQI